MAVTTERSIDAQLRAGLPPVDDAPGLELIAEPIRRFRRGQLDARGLTDAIDPIGRDIELELYRRITEAEREHAETAEALHASLRWIKAFPCWSPVWRT